MKGSSAQETFNPVYNSGGNAVTSAFGWKEKKRSFGEVAIRAGSLIGVEVFRVSDSVTMEVDKCISVHGWNEGVDPLYAR